jgi:phosphoglycerate kinase
MTEVPACAKGSETIALAIADCSGYSVIGGGDTEELVNQFQLQGRFSHVSTGGGASLMYIGGQPLPGLEILE